MLLRTSLLAHSDPRGDVHPIVTVEGSHFVVRASSNIVENETIRLLIQADGTLKQESRQIVPPADHTPYQEYSFIDRLPEEHDGALYVGVVVPRFFGYRLLLVRWNGNDPSYSQRTLSSNIDWNTSVSLANIGKAALITYHYPGEYPRWPFYIDPPNAKIITIPFKLK